MARSVYLKIFIYTCPLVSVVMSVFSVGKCSSCSDEFTKLFAGVLSFTATFRFLIHVPFEYVEIELSFYFFSLVWKKRWNKAYR